MGNILIISRNNGTPLEYALQSLGTILIRGPQLEAPLPRMAKRLPIAELPAWCEKRSELEIWPTHVEIDSCVVFIIRQCLIL